MLSVLTVLLDDADLGDNNQQCKGSSHLSFYTRYPSIHLHANTRIFAIIAMMRVISIEIELRLGSVRTKPYGLSLIS
jgi:hypothetical protein